MAAAACGLAALLPAVVLAGGSPPPTDCVHLCPDTYPADPCVVDTVVDVTPGSIINCGSRLVEVGAGGVVRVTDGRFVLRAGTVKVDSAGEMTATCSQSTRHGFTLEVEQDVIVETQGKLRASCDGGGGRVAIQAGRDVTVGVGGVRADGTAPNAAGGLIEIVAGRDFLNTHDISASATGGTAEGGEIAIEARGTLSVEGALAANGYGSAGGTIRLSADGDVTIASPNVASVSAAATVSGDGGTITLVGHNITVSRRLVAKGVGAESSGGQVEVKAERAIDLSNDINASAGTDGGEITVAAEGPISIGSAGATGFELGVNGANGGVGGEITIRSDGDDISVYGKLSATDQVSGAAGGTIRLEGVSITAASPSHILADGSASGEGGVITIVGRDQIVLDGTLHANNGEAEFIYRQTPPQVGSGVSGPWTQTQDTTLPPPCGDGFVRTGEDCDGLDLGESPSGGEMTCADLPGFSGGTLTCTSSCTYDTSGCTP